MKKTTLLLMVALMISSISLAQSIKIKRGVALVDRVEYCKVESEGWITKDHTFSTLNDEEFAYAKYVTYPDNYSGSSTASGYFEIRFVDSNLITEMENNSLRSMAKVLVKEFYKSGVLDGNTVNMENVEKFHNKHNGGHSGMMAEADQRRQDALNQAAIERNRVLRDDNAPVEVINNELYQDSKRIGYVKREGLGDYQVFLPSGKLVAKVSIRSNLESDVDIQTMNDGEMHSFSLGYGTSQDHVKKFIEYLIANKYM